MKKILIPVLAAAVLAVGGYAHYHYWLKQSNLIKEHIEELASQNSENFRLTYDSIEIAGYPFRHEVAMKNPCFYFLDTDSNFNMHVAEGCLQGTMLLSYQPFTKDRSLYIETEGSLKVAVPLPEIENLIPVEFKGKLTQEYEFKEGYDFKRSSNYVYMIEHLLKANIKAHQLTIKTLEENPKVFVDQFNGSLEYSTRPHGEDSQKVQLLFDYDTLVGDPISDYKDSAYPELAMGLNKVIAKINRESGPNTGRYDLTMVIPSWAFFHQEFEKIKTLSFNPEEIPDISLNVEQVNKNNFFAGKGLLDADWIKGKEGQYHFQFKNTGIQDISKEGASKLEEILDDLMESIVKYAVHTEVKDNTQHKAIDKLMQLHAFAEVFQGLPTHYEFELQFTVEKAVNKSKTAEYAIVINPFSLSTDKGGINLTAEYTPNVPFKIVIKVDSFVRIVDGLITRYNSLAKLLQEIEPLPLVTEKERNELLAIFKRYSDTPDKQPKNVTFTIKDNLDGGVTIGKGQNAMGLIGELGFFFKHLEEKVSAKASH